MRIPLARICEKTESKPRWFGLTFRAILDIGPDGALVRVIDFTAEGERYQVDIEKVPWSTALGKALAQPHMWIFCAAEIEEVTQTVRFWRGYIPEHKRKFWFDPDISIAQMYVHDPAYITYTWNL